MTADIYGIEKFGDNIIRAFKDILGLIDAVTVKVNQQAAEIKDLKLTVKRLEDTINSVETRHGHHGSGMRI